MNKAFKVNLWFYSIVKVFPYITTTHTHTSTHIHSSCKKEENEKMKKIVNEYIRIK